VTYERLAFPSLSMTAPWRSRDRDKNRVSEAINGDDLQMYMLGDGNHQSIHILLFIVFHSDL
jgi:hypothetical protein